ncbi:MAG: hypothetical protein GX660_15480 [Clostridiaceae bacterium]|nr:hypothetical protein [Clostridiaceae bacterium]
MTTKKLLKGLIYVSIIMAIMIAGFYVTFARDDYQTRLLSKKNIIVKMKNMESKKDASRFINEKHKIRRLDLSNKAYSKDIEVYEIGDTDNIEDVVEDLKKQMELNLFKKILFLRPLKFQTISCYSIVLNSLKKV